MSLLRKILTVLLTFACVAVSYSPNVIARHLFHGMDTMVMESRFDINIPVIPIFAIPYLSMLVFAPFITPLVSLFFGSFRLFLANAYAIVLQQIYLALGFFLLPSIRYHGSLEGGSAFDPWVIFAWCGTDALHLPECPATRLAYNYASFPSGHASMVAITILAWLQLRRRFPILTPLAILWSLIVLLSTLFVHEHYMIELYVGLPIGFSAYTLSSKIFVRQNALEGN